MLHMTFKDASKSYYECSRYFQPIESDIELGVEGDMNGLTQVQKDFFSSIEKPYDDIISSIAPIIEIELKN